MTNKPIFQQFEANRNSALAVKMAAYMKNKFPFLGINSPKRKLLQKNFLREKLKPKIIDWDFIFLCFNMPEREFQYMALDYLISLKKHVNVLDINKKEKLILTKSWWDSVDSIDH